MMEPPKVKTLEIEFRESKLGNEVLVINGCKYIVNRRSGDTVYWRCSFSWCHSRAVIKAGHLRSARGEHVCPQANNRKLEEFPREVSIPPSNTVQPMLSPNPYKSDPHNKKSPRKSLTQADCAKAIRLDESLLEASRLKEASISVAENTGSSSSSFLEFLEDSSIIQQDDEILSDEISDEDAAWKQRVLAELKVYSKAEQIRRLKIAYEIRKTWRNNKKHLHDHFAVREKKWTSSNATWSFSVDWPSRSKCMKFIKPERGAGVNINQPEVPIKIMDEVKPSLQLPSLNESAPSTSTQAIPERKRSCDGKNNLKRKSDELKETDLKDNDYKPLKSRGKCPICKKVFRSSLERHLNVHYGIKPYTCEKCHKTFSQQHSYRDHCRLHTRERPYVCTSCPKTFNSKANLKRHIETHTSGRSLSCSTCGKRFRKTKFLASHSLKCSKQEETAPSAMKTTEITAGTGSESEVTEVLQQLPSTSKTRSRKRRVTTENPEGDDRRILTLTHEISVVEKELEKRRQQYLLESMEENQESDPSKSGARLFTLEELKYAEFLQPKVVLSKSLSVFISKMTAGKRAPLGPSTANTNIAFNSRVKPFGASVPLGRFHNKPF